MLQPGEQIDRYIVEADLGAGGMATVYRAHHAALPERRVAIKLLHPHLARNQRARDRFVTEARVQSSLQSAHIAQVFDVISWRDVPAMVLAWYPAGSLAAQLERGTRYNLRETMRIAEHVLRALEVAHAAGVVHRDLKPDNILLDQTDGALHAVVADFGIAKVRDSIQETVTGAQLGTYAYMSPEQINDASRVDQRTDLYSVGVTLWELLSQQAPYPGHSYSDPQFVAVVARAQHGPLPQWVPAPIAAWVGRLLAPNPSERFGSATEALRAMPREDSGARPAVGPTVLDSDDGVPPVALPVGPRGTATTSQGEGRSRVAKRRRRRNRGLVIAGVGILAAGFGLLALQAGDSTATPPIVAPAQIATPAVVAQASPPPSVPSPTAAPAQPPPLQPPPPPVAAPPSNRITEQSLHGTWNANFQKTLENQEMTEEERNMAMAFIAMMQMSMTFAPSGAMTMSATMMGQTERQNGTYEVLSVHDDTITIRATKEAEGGAKQPEVETMVVTFENNNSIIMRQGTETDGETLYFDRAR